MSPALFPKHKLMVADIAKNAPDAYAHLLDSDFYIEYIPMSWLPMNVALDFQSYQDEISALSAEEQAGATPAPERLNSAFMLMGRMLKLMVTNWNLTDENDQPLPQLRDDGEAWRQLPLQFLSDAIGMMVAQDTGTEIPLGSEPSSSGESTEPQPQEAQPAQV